ncbi:hypothetical protein BDW69DRAFT_72379 [Aspergillus filifer]
MRRSTAASTREKRSFCTTQLLLHLKSVSNAGQHEHVDGFMIVSYSLVEVTQRHTRDKFPMPLPSVNGRWPRLFPVRIGHLSIDTWSLCRHGMSALCI